MFRWRMLTVASLLGFLPGLAVTGCANRSEDPPRNESAEERIAGEGQPDEPNTLLTKTFGRLVLHRELDWFAGEATWNGRRVAVHFPTDRNGSIANALKAAETLWANQSRWKRDVEDFAVQKLLPIKNQHWLEEGERPVTKDEFLRRMKLQSISVSNQGDLEFWYDDGELFLGHSIQVFGSLTAGLTGADIPD